MKLVTPPKDKLLFLPLGGSGEIGMNLNLYGYDGHWLIVDCGVTFGDIDYPSVDIVMPDISVIEEHKEKISGLVLTHAHEDHIGAVHYLWPYLKCPIYATPFAAEVLKFKFKENELDFDEKELKINIIQIGSNIKINGFQIEIINMTHSILEPTGLLIKTKVGSVFHTGDWKIDFSPQIGKAIDEYRLKKLGKKDIMAMICDSTNIFVKDNAGSEADVVDKLTEQIRESEKRVFVTTFASNVMRLKTIVNIGKTLGRQIAFAGRSMHRMLEIANNCGYLMEMPTIIKEKNILKIPREETLVICTGSQGESRGALNRIVNDNHKTIKMNEGDKVIFSSRIIPGNEKYIYKLQNKLSGKGVDVIQSSSDLRIHVSGHPGREDLAQMYKWVKPKALIAVHGETRHINAHVKFAKDKKIKEAIPAKNGHIIEITSKAVIIAGEVESGRLVVDGNYIINRNSEVLKSRHKMMLSGIVNVLLILDENNNLLLKPSIFVEGLVDNNVEENPKDLILDIIMSHASEFVKITQENKKQYADLLAVELKRNINHKYSKKPIINLIIEIINKKRSN